jgi:flagellar assembly protein FliH
MRKPAFMEGTQAVPVTALKIVAVDPARIRGVAWAPSPVEPAIPELSVVKPPPTPPPPVYKESPSQVFAPLRSEPPPPPPPAFSPLAEEKLKAALSALSSEGERLAEQARADALELGILIARRIVERELSMNLESVFSLIKSALRRVGEENVTRVRLHPRDVARFEAAVQSDFSLGKVELVGDGSLQPGDVMVDTSSHTIDGRLSTRFDELVRQLDGAES